MAFPRLLPKLAAVSAVAGRTRYGVGVPIATLIALLTTAMPSAAESIPLESSGGVYMLPVRINDAVTIPFVIDSGASEVAIPADVFLVLSRSGTVSQTDSLGTRTYTMANGTTQSSERFRLRKLMVGNHVVTDVVANVIPVNGDPLLGQSFLSRLPAWSIDNARHTLVLNDAGAATPTTSYAPVLAGHAQGTIAPSGDLYWSGTYNCLQGNTALRLKTLMSSDGTVKALFEFGPTAGNNNVPNGSFLLKGTIRSSDGYLELFPEYWISQPPGYAMVGLSGKLAGNTYSGSVTGVYGCSSFFVSRQ